MAVFLQLSAEQKTENENKTPYVSLSEIGVKLGRLADGVLIRRTYFSLNFKETISE